MTETPHKTTPSWAELSDDVLESVEVGRKTAIEAEREFVDEVSPVIDDQSRRKTIIDAAPEFGRGACHDAYRVPA